MKKYAEEEQGKLIAALIITLEHCKLRGKKTLVEDLEAVLLFLPEYPVFAILEAESRGLGVYFINLIRNSFNVLPLA